ncbi:MAG TPA: transglutaminase family protein [Chthoniobacteraceae bacterium]|jgi:transglutaminase-like putative cysteine protease|nr:transglutaminase family protein [Chthoniobacteraceae bacterium]
MLYSISHRTTYAYDATVSLSMHRLHLRPRELPRQELVEFSLEIDPAPTAEVPEMDYYGNPAGFLAIEGAHRGLTVIARGKIRLKAPAWPDANATPQWETVRECCAVDVLTQDSQAGEFLFDSPHVVRSQAFTEYAAPSFPQGAPILASVLDLTSRIYRNFKFDRRATNIATPIAEVLKNRRGVCQDFAHLAICCLRSLGLPARYVSGYIETIPPPGGVRLVGADASHAWFSFWCPGSGWIDADPTNNVLVADRHITVAWGRDFSDVSPVQGVVVGGGSHSLRVGIDVAPIEETTPLPG